MLFGVFMKQIFQWSSTLGVHVVTFITVLLTAAFMYLTIR